MTNIKIQLFEDSIASRLTDEVNVWLDKNREDITIIEKKIGAERDYMYVTFWYYITTELEKLT